MSASAFAVLLTMLPLQAGGVPAQPVIPPSATQQTAGRYTVDTPVADLLANAATKAVLEKDVPKMVADPRFAQYDSMSLRQMQPFANGALSDEGLAKIDADLRAAAGAPDRTP